MAEQGHLEDKSRMQPAPDSTLSPEMGRVPTRESLSSGVGEPLSPSINGLKTPGLTSSPSSPFLSRTASFDHFGDDEYFPPLEKLSVFDILDNFSLPGRLEKFSSSISAQTEKVRRSQQRLKSTGSAARDKVVEEWRRRVPTADEQLDKYRKRMKQSVDRLGRKWNDNKVVTLREKFSFIAGVLNIFISGYLIGAWPEYFHWWYTAQVAYFYPVRFFTYRKKGYHYFLADLCYFVNLLLLLSLWAFPQSKRLLISTYCLAYGNNAVAIAMWRNSLVFHSLDKVTSLFIHIMPCVTLHTMVHLLDEPLQKERFPAVHTIKYSKPDSPEHYTLRGMIVWATVPYAFWQISYHLLITVRRREKIAAGRPTSFTWLRKSYAPTWIGKFVLSLPETLQEPAFMMIQYTYALMTMVPCPIWFWYRWASAGFLMSVFVWSVYNGATYYIDIFGTRFQKELEALKKDVAKWQGSPELKDILPTPKTEGVGDLAETPQKISMGAAAGFGGLAGTVTEEKGHAKQSSVDDIPLLDDHEGSTALEGKEVGDGVTARK